MPNKRNSTYKKSRNQAKAIASRQMFTASGERIRNVDAYVAAGGVPHTANGSRIHNPTAYGNVIEASVRQNTDDPKYLYHYTDTTGAEGISQSGTIAASTDGYDGAGTYVTAKPPRCTSETLLRNNYGGGATGKDDSRVESYVRIDNDGGTLDANRLDCCDRDVWKVNGDIHLNDHNAFVAPRSNNNSSGGGSRRRHRGEQRVENTQYNDYCGSEEEDYYY